MRISDWSSDVCSSDLVDRGRGSLCCKTDGIPVLLILGVSATIGFLEGVVAGIVAGIAIFVVSYSRTSIVKNTLTGARLHSNVDRAESQRGVLRDEGDQILILKLQGFIRSEEHTSELQTLKRISYAVFSLTK